MAKLFKGDSDRDAHLRRQIVDLEPPAFSRKRRNDTVTMSSQTSDIAQFFSLSYHRKCSLLKKKINLNVKSNP